jgi:CBS domain containing-hemolysin-like protein
MIPAPDVAWLDAALARRPRPGDVAIVDGVEIRVQEVDGLRITKLRVVLPEQESA